MAIQRRKKAAVTRKKKPAVRRVTKKTAARRVAKKAPVRRRVVKKKIIRRNPCNCAKNPTPKKAEADHLIISVVKQDAMPEVKRNRLFDKRAYWDGLAWTKNRRNAVRFHSPGQAQKVADTVVNNRKVHDNRIRTVYVMKDYEHPKTNGARKRNPVPLSKTAKVLKAIELYERFTGHTPQHVDTVNFRVPNTALKVGKMDGILYTTVRDGKKEKYIHKFAAKSRPLLLSTFDGKQLVIFGGRYHFTERGIVDK